jgi:hypothetical protein
MRLRVLHGLLAFFVAIAATAIAAAQAPAEERKPLAIALALDPATQLEGELIRAQLERELAVVVVTTDVPAEITAEALRIEAPSLQAVRVSFRDSERTVDLSTTGPHAIETLALVAANLMRDEASDLLATLRATEPPTPTRAPTPPASPVAERPKEPERRGCDPTRFERVPFAANLVPHVGTSTFQGTDVQLGAGLHLIGGSVSALRGFELAGVFNHESYSMCGAQIAGAINLVNGPMYGFQLAPLNMVDGRVDGGQVAFVNTSSGTIHGFQAAFLNLALRGGDAVQIGFANLVTDYLVGTQIGFGNVATGTVEGAQFGFGNVTLGSVDGVQAGFVNIAQDSLTGAQAGFVNITAGDSAGMQLGFANTAKQSRGIMLGFVNISENADAAVGLLNIYTKGRTQLDAWVTDAGLVMIGVEHGGRLLHNIIGMGYTNRSAQGVFAFAYGIGARIHESNALFIDVDAIGYGLMAQKEREDRFNFGSILQLRVPIGYRITPSVAVFASPSLNVSVARTKDNFLREPGFYGARMTADDAAATASIWPGVSLGARFF